MPFPIPLPFLVATVIALVVAGIVPIVSNARSKVREVHARSLFNQIREVVAIQGFPADQGSLLAALRRSNIDWNSCGIEGEALLDGWRRPISVNITQSSLVVRSAGRDGLLDTADDITEKMSNSLVVCGVGQEESVRGRR